jgi:serine-type D-Ala-D-Ala carboxypeptidase (penicillin-binding protein 5/6)
MWKSNAKRLKNFLHILQKQPKNTQLAGIALFLAALLYPGQNYLQRLVLNPGPVRSYELGEATPILYPLSDGVKAPGLSATGVVVQDIESKTIVYAKYPDAPLLPASTTKIMTALVTLDEWSDLETVIEVKNEDRAIGQTIELQKGEKMTIRSLLYGLLVHSGNDAALALADNYPGGYNKFVEAMNAKAKALHLDHTTYRNPSGIEQYGHTTTARDLAILAGIAMKNPIVAEIVSTKSKVITDVTGTITHNLESTNELLGILPGMKGLKTGWTANAGECLVSVVERDTHMIVVVVLNSLDRFGETTKIVEWVYAHHNWMIPEL